MSWMIRSVALLVALAMTGRVAAQAPAPTAAEVAHARALRQIEVQRPVQPYGPAAQNPPSAQPPSRQIIVPGLSDDGIVRTFESRVSELCRIRFAVGRRDRRSASPAGSLVGQNPSAGTVIGCGRAVTVYVAVPEPPAPAPYIPAPTPPPPAPQIRVPRLFDDGVVRTFESRVSELCRSRFAVSRRDRRSASPAGSLVGQDPSAGTIIGCGRAVAVYVAVPEPPAPIPDTPAPTRPAPPPSAPRLVVPDLSGTTTLLNFQSLVRSACRNDFAVARLARPSARPAGAFLTQAPEIGTAIGCGARVSVSYASGEPPALPPAGGAAPIPARPKPTRTWPMPDMREPGADELLDRQMQARCPNRPVVRRVQTASPREDGALIAQVPPPGSEIDCDATITIERVAHEQPRRPWWPIALGFVAVAAAAAGALLRRALLHPRIEVGATGFAAAPGDGWTGGPIARIAIVSGGTTGATPPAPLPVAAVEVMDV